MEDVTTEQQQIVNGETDFTGVEFMQYRTARLRNGCSGTILDPVTVLTARHCLTKDGSPFGPLESASAHSARRWGGSWSTARKLVTKDGGYDVALLLLEEPILDWGDFPIFTPMDPYSPSNYKDDRIYISGWGSTDNNSDENLGVLRWGRMIVHDDYVEKNCAGKRKLMKLRQTSADQRGAPGDSGGPYWGSRTRPQGVIGVHSGDTCGLDPREQGTRVLSIRTWARDVISADHGYDSARFKNVYFDASADVADSRSYSPVGDAPRWGIDDGDLVQHNNVPNTPIIWPKLSGRDFLLQTSFMSPDDDAAGVAFHFVDEDNYYYCEADEQNGYLRLRRRYKGSETTLASQPWSGNMSSHKTMKVRGDNTTYSCQYDGVTVTVADYRMPVGGFGLWQDFNAGVRFSYFHYRGSFY